MYAHIGVLNVNAKVAEGQVAIAKFTTVRTADPKQKTRHLWFNLRIERQIPSVRRLPVQLTEPRVGTAYDAYGTGKKARQGSTGEKVA